MKQAEEQDEIQNETVQTDDSGSAAKATEADAPAEEQAPGSAEPVVEDPEEESAKVQLLRLRADFDNFRKRTRKEKEEWTQRCLENLCSDLLTVLDHFDLGIENSKGPELTEDMLKGFVLVREQLGSTLGKYGLSPVVVEEKAAFDPNEHEAITHLPSPEVPEGAVMAMTRKGYHLGNRMLRPVQVVVSSGSGESGEAG